MRIIYKEENRNTTAGVLLVVLLGFLFLFFPVEESKAWMVEEDEPMPIRCDNVDPLETPDLPQSEESEIVDNKALMPIGRSADFSEMMAQDLIDWTLIMANQAQLEIEAAEDLLAESRSCRETGICRDNCRRESYDCDPARACDDVMGCSWWDPWGGKHECGGGNCSRLPEIDCGLSDDICCCSTCYECFNAPCEGGCHDTATVMEVQIVNWIIPPAQIIDHYHDRIEITYFWDRFWPLQLYVEQYGIYIGNRRVEEPTRSDVRDYLAQYLDYMPTWLNDAISAMENRTYGEWYGLSAWDDVARTLCLMDMGSHWDDFCISPIEKNITNDDLEEDTLLGLWGMLDKARARLSTCATPPYRAEAVLSGEETGRYAFTCRQVLSWQIIIRSFIEEYGLDQDGDPLEGLPMEGCYGHHYERAKSEAGENTRYGDPCAEDYYCCIFNAGG